FKGNAVTPPSAPTNLTPLNGSVGAAVNPVLAWTASSGATSYRVQVSSNPAFSSTVIDSANIAATSVSIGGLANNAQYYWHVSASNAGGPGSYSTAFSFTTIVSPPAAPALVSPANGATGLNTTLSVVWRSSATATSYRLQTSLDPNFTTTLINQSGITDTTFQLVSLGLNVKLYWRVSASNAGGAGSFGSPFNFTTITSSTDVDDNSNGIPTHFALSQNFPNPFNPSTEISFAIPTRSWVRIDIYNMLGSLVTTLVDRELPAGRHHSTWNGQAAPSGVYLYRLTAGDFVDTKKMLLIK
ncbi:MAG: T9SS type A sorting domain-containing protein, partial [Candidatus Zixiibacteriota bacterium]